MEENIDKILASFKKIAQDAKNGEDNARRVANELRDEAMLLRGIADAMVLMTRTLTGDISKEPPSRKTVVLKSEEDARAYKESKKKPAQKKKRKYHLSPEGRKRIQENCKKMREAAALRKKMTAIVNANAEEANGL